MSAEEAVFLDTNILVYAASTDPRAAVAERLLEGRWKTSVQALNEFANVARRKLGWSWSETRDALATFRTLSTEILPLDLETHEAALELCERHALSFYDSLMVAAALRADAAVLLSEDMQDGLVVGRRLTIRNPFAR